MVRKYSADLVVDQESIKEYTRKYVGDFFIEQNIQRAKLAECVVALTECVLLEQGIS